MVVSLLAETKSKSIEDGFLLNAATKRRRADGDNLRGAKRRSAKNHAQRGSAGCEDGASVAITLSNRGEPVAYAWTTGIADTMAPRTAAAVPATNAPVARFMDRGAAAFLLALIALSCALVIAGLYRRFWRLA